MKNLLSVLLGLAVSQAGHSLNLLTYTTRHDDQSYVRFYNVVDDIDVTFKEYEARDAFGVQIEDSYFIRSSGDIATLYVDGQPYASVRVDGKLGFERLDQPIDVLPREAVLRLQQIEGAMNRGTVIGPDTEGIFPLSGNRIFWAGLYTDRLYYPARTGYLTTKVTLPQFSWPQHASLVEYSPGKVAYVNFGGTVGCFAIDAANKVTVIGRIFDQFRAALKSGNVGDTLKLMSWRLPPMNVSSGQTLSHLDLVMNTRNPGFIVGVLRGLKDVYAIPFESTARNFTYNPIFQVLDNRDNVTLKALLAEFPQLANERSLDFGGHENSILPFLACVLSGNLAGCQILAEFGAADDERGYPPQNSLSVSPSGDMTEYLLKLGVEKTIGFQTSATINSDGVRIRSDYNTSASVVGRLVTGQEVRILRVTALTFFVSGYPDDRWYQIESDAGNGWVFGAFLDLAPMAGT